MQARRWTEVFERGQETRVGEEDCGVPERSRRRVHRDPPLILGYSQARRGRQTVTGG
jgi:hypothetical protein